jgi:O-antigen ligase
LSKILGQVHGRKEKDLMQVELLFLVFWGYLGFNGLTAVVRGISPVDVMRDLVPMVNLVMFLVIKQFGKKTKTIEMLEKTQFSIMMVVSIKGTILIATGMYFLHSFFPFHWSILQITTLLILSIPSIAYLKDKRLFIIAIIATSIFFLLTPTRTQFFCALGSAVLMMLLIRRSRRIVTLTIGAAIMLTIIYFAASVYAPAALATKEERLSAAVSGSELSIESRVDEMEQCFELFKQSPITGVGLGYNYHFWRHWVTGKGPGYLNTNFTHSDFMFLLSKTGFIGIVLFLALYYQFCKMAFVVWKKAETIQTKIKGLTCFVAFIAAFALGQSTPIIQTRRDTLMLGLLMGYVYCLYRNTLKEKALTPIKKSQIVQSTIKPVFGAQ